MYFIQVIKYTCWTSIKNWTIKSIHKECTICELFTSFLLIYQNSDLFAFENTLHECVLYVKRLYI